MENKKFSQELKKRMYVFVLDVLKNLKSVDRSDVSSVLSRQLIRSSTSVIANYVEAQAASSTKDFKNFLHHSLKSANESKVWLALLRDTDLLDKARMRKLLTELNEISNILAKSIITLKGKK